MRKMMRLSMLLAVGPLCAVGFLAAAQDVQSPEDFLGHAVGADYKLAKWDRIVAYFRRLDAQSDRVAVRDLGTTTEGLPMIFAEIASAETIANLEPHRANQRKIADPRTIADETEEQRLIWESKVPVFINCQLHSTETAASQMSMELAYQLATGDTPEVQEILDRVIVLLIPCANPDGQLKVVEWYERTLGLPWEGTGMPWLYQRYAGHDNNRDWYMLSLQETRLTTEVLYQEWFPTIVWDVHQMGNSSARLFVPPFHDPKNLNVHPVIDQTLLIIGGHVAADLARKDLKGVVHGAMYDNWWAGGFRTTPYRHNMVGILTEAASVNVASPVFQRKSQLTGASRGLPEYDVMTNFPDPWPGGWWRLRDIVDYELSTAYSLLKLAARYHDQFQSNYIHMGREAIARGTEEPPFAWLVPPDQRDPGSAYEMITRLRATGIEVHLATAEFTADGVTYPAGTYIMYCAQPYRPHLMDMMERQVYPDREQYPGGPAEQPYDMAGWTLPLQMGVRHLAVSGPFEADARLLEEITYPQGTRSGEANPEYWMVHPGHNDFYRLLARLHGQGVKFSLFAGDRVIIPQAEQALAQLAGAAAPQRGSLIIPVANLSASALDALREGLSVEVVGGSTLPLVLRELLVPAVAPRTALYQPWTASMDEGWTRLVLEQFEQPYTTLHNAEIRAGDLRARYDCIVLPSVGASTILSGSAEDSTFPEYAGGIGAEGVVALQEFAHAGGTLVCIDASCALPIREFNIPVKNILDGKKSSEFYCPGSVLRLSIDTEHPLGFGMSAWYSGYFAGSQAFAIEAPPSDKEGDSAAGRAPSRRFPAKAVSRYSDTVLLESGWIRGGDLIADQPAIVEVAYGDGQIDLLGFGVQRRAQPHGTFKILFNAILRSVL